MDLCETALSGVCTCMDLKGCRGPKMAEEQQNESRGLGWGRHRDHTSALPGLGFYLCPGSKGGAEIDD